MEIWAPKHPGTLWATPGLLRDCLQSSEAIMLCGNLGAGNFPSAKKCHKYTLEYILEIVQGEIKDYGF